MILVVDIGNTNITIGVFDNDELIEIHRLNSDMNNTAFDYETELRNMLSDKNIEGCIISSVVDELTFTVKQACNGAFDIDSILFTYDMNLEIGLKTEKPHTIGTDRLANVYAVLKYELPAIVVDIGTAVTFDILDENKNFIGGVIMPGINMGLKGLYEATSKLPEINAKESPIAIGNTTETCILSGVVRGTACAIDGLLEQCEEELGKKASIILTGGQSWLISKYMKRTFDCIEPNLTLYGLKNIYEYLKCNQN